MTLGHRRLNTADLLCLCSALVALGCGGQFTSDGGGSGGSSAGAGGSSAGAGGAGAGGSSAGAGGSSAAGGAGAGGSSAGAGGSSAAGGSGAGGGGGNSHWECQTNHDCGEGRCVQLVPGGFQTCASPVEHATECVGPDPECCSDAECGSRTCLVAPLFPYCGGAQMAERSVCASDECTSTANCTGDAICVPAGVFGSKVAVCREFLCTKDSDCGEDIGGKCAAITNPCCSGSTLSCVYPGGCFSNAECEEGAYCQPKPGGASCLAGEPTCPA